MEYYWNINSEQKEQLHYSLSDCVSSNFEINESIGAIYRLPASDPIKEIKINNISESLYVTLNCNKEGENNIYSWNLYCEESSFCSKRSGLKFILINDRVTKVLMTFSAITFYISIVIVIGRIIRGAVEGMETEIISTELPHPDDILNICEAIVIARNEGNYSLYDHYVGR